MNMFTSMIDTINAAPALIESANTLAAQQAHGAPSAEALAPIAGVSLETYAKVSKGIAAFGYDTTKLVDVAAGLGVSAADWAVAQEGWGARTQADRAVGSRFNELYTGL